MPDDVAALLARPNPAVMATLGVSAGISTVRQARRELSPAHAH